MTFVESLNSDARQLFRRAGWVPGRSMPVPFYGASLAPEDSFALAVLSEVGNLVVGTTASGTDCVSSDVVFRDRYGAERASIVQSLYPGVGHIAALGEAHSSYIWLFVNDRGNLLAFTEIDEKLYVAGDSISQGVERLLLGHRWDFACA